MTLPAIERIALVTDFGPGIYPGQVRGRLSALAPALPVIDLVHDLTPFRPDLAAYLLPALVRDMPSGTLYLCVVDPGVGGARAALAVAAGGDLLVGPDNGLLAPLVKRSPGAAVRRIDWQPAEPSASFHGRDWLAPAAARLALGQALATSPMDPAALVGADWPDELAAAVYVDRYGNVMTGMRAAGCPPQATIALAGRTLRSARTFCEVGPGEPFWYENALGLVEIAVNLGRADLELGLAPGDPIPAPSL
jgi:S-adenosylmethionine hydrolase